MQVRVVEAPPKRLSVSMGVDDEAGARLESIYRQNVVFGQPLTLETGFSVDRLRQRAYADFLLPPTERGYKDSFGVLADRSDIQGLEVTRYALGATRLQERKGAGDSRVEYETRWGLLLAQDHVRIEDGDEYTLPSATATAEWLRRDVDSKYDPREGNLIAVGGGLGVVLNTGEPYTRARLRGQKWWPIGRRDVLTVRGEVGRIWANGKVQVPDDFGFRTGGARSIRGYKYQSIGLKRNSAIVGAPAMVVGSVEYDHYFNERWGMGVFVDAGDAAKSFGDMSLAVGYGVGARVRTPAGPCSWTWPMASATAACDCISPWGSRFEDVARDPAPSSGVVAARLAMLAVLACGFLFWLAGTQSGTRLLLTTAAQQLDGQALDVRGSVLRGLNVGRLELETGGTRVEIADLGLKVDWRALGQRRLHVRELSAAAVTVTLAPAAAEETPPAQDEAPFSLPSLPVDIALDQLTLGEFHLLQNGEALPVSLGGLAATFAAGQDSAAWHRQPARRP